jgi:hypothetical protein
MSEHPRLQWRELAPDLHAGIDGDRVVALVYPVTARDANGYEWLEMTCLLTGPPVYEEVLFGVGGRGPAFESRWERGRRAAEIVLRNR